MIVGEETPRAQPRSGDVLDSVDEQAAELIARRRSASVPRYRRQLIRPALVLADVVGFLVALGLTLVLVGGGSPGLRYGLFAGVLCGWLIAAKLFGLYSRDEERFDQSTVDELVRIFVLLTVGAFLFTQISVLTDAVHPSAEQVTVFWALAVAAVLAARTAARAIVRRNSAYVQNALIVGAGDVGQNVARKLLQHPEYRLSVVGFVDDAPKQRAEDLGRLTIVGDVDSLPELIQLLDVERVIVAFSRDSADRSLELVRELRDLPVRVDIVPRLFEAVGPDVEIDWLEAMPLVGLPRVSARPGARLVKRGLDILGSLTALIVTAPVFAVVAWRIKRDSDGPVFFRQTRLGRDMKEFTIVKFRTMYVDADQDAHRETIKATMQPGAASLNGLYKAENGHAITGVGRWLRRTSLDELPQLINVLRGEMSLVGPRPSLPYEIDHFEPHHFERFRVAPGLTGLWQVKARALTSWREAVEMDVAYVRGWSLGLDLSLLCRTPAQLIRLKTR